MHNSGATLFFSDGFWPALPMVRRFSNYLNRIDRTARHPAVQRGIGVITQQASENHCSSGSAAQGTASFAVLRQKVRMLQLDFHAFAGKEGLKPRTIDLFAIDRSHGIQLVVRAQHIMMK
jgi:hypothetical protein